MKKKLLGMLLAGTLMVGAVGSYAWFSDKAEVDSGIKLTMGTLDVDVKEISDGWDIVDETSEIINKKSTKHFKNVRPGDSFQREFVIANSGTLKQKVSVKLNPEVARKVVTTIGDQAVLFDDLFNLKFELGELELPMKINENETFEFELDSLYTEAEDSDKVTSAADLKVTLEVDKDAMDNRFNHDGNKFVEIFDFLKDKSVPLVLVEAEQVNK
ncbi:TasA family protein [Clostridium perfringens]|uniref:TasA family protein n=1 Tax=Clostridium perfringens TaxID=1502 RepID=UPI002A308835|nr:TasA family protein [Clostridium perfringens]